MSGDRPAFRVVGPHQGPARLRRLVIALDARYATAWAGLATVHAELHEWWGARDEDLERADRASRRALELAPDLAESHVARGSALALSQRADEAAREFDAAIRLNPRLFEAYYYFGRLRFAGGDTEGSAELFAAAKAGLHEEALELLERVFARGWGKRDWVEHDPDYDALRGPEVPRAARAPTVSAGARSVGVRAGWHSAQAGTARRAADARASDRADRSSPTPTVIVAYETSAAPA